MKHVKSFNEKLKIKNVKMIDVGDWDDLVSSTYDRIYCYQQQDGCRDRGSFDLTIPCEYADSEDAEMNDSIPEVINGNEMCVKFQVWLDRDPNAPLNPSKEELKKCNYFYGGSEEDEKAWKEDQGHIDMFWERNFYPNINVLANDLYNKGLIEAGEYVIDIDW